MEESMLEVNDRLTIPHAGHERKRTQYGYTAYWTQASKFDLMNRLGEYEDTGLTPLDVLKIVTLANDLANINAVAVGDGAFYVTGCGIGNYNAILKELHELLDKGEHHE